jgi:hypothetical protein
MIYEENQDLIKVKDKNYLFRDINSEAIVNGDYEGYNRYVEEYKKKYRESKKIEKIESELNDIHNDISEIKNLLRNLVNGS